MEPSMVVEKIDASRSTFLVAKKKKTYKLFLFHEVRVDFLTRIEVNSFG